MLDHNVPGVLDFAISQLNGRAISAKNNADVQLRFVLENWNEIAAGKLMRNIFRVFYQFDNDRKPKGTRIENATGGECWQAPASCSLDT